MRLANPLIRRLVQRARGRQPQQVLVLHFRGRRSGHPYSIPVGYRRIDGRLAILTDGRWRHNFRGGADVQVTLKGRLRRARAEVQSDPLSVACLYDRLLGELGWRRAARQLGMRVNVGRPPTLAELEEMVRRSGLSVVWLDLEED
jgi:hypothetical protein